MPLPVNARDGSRWIGMARWMSVGGRWAFMGRNRGHKSGLDNPRCPWLAQVAIGRRKLLLQPRDRSQARADPPSRSCNGGIFRRGRWIRPCWWVVTHCLPACLVTRVGRSSDALDVWLHHRFSTARKNLQRHRHNRRLIGGYGSRCANRSLHLKVAFSISQHKQLFAFPFSPPPVKSVWVGTAQGHYLGFVLLLTKNGSFIWLLCWTSFLSPKAM
jgi:hypothetical protein